MYKALYNSPMIPSFNLKETILFFKDILKFSPVLDSDDYAVYMKDNLTVHILPAGKQIGQMEFYLEVDNIDALWTAIQPRVHGMKVRGPFDREYGMREVHIEVPQTKTLLFIGQRIDRSPA